MPEWVNDRHDVRTYINYASHRGSQADAGDPRRLMTVANARGREGDFELDRNGFEFVVLSPRERRVDSDNAIETDFYVEVEAIIKQRTGASYIFPAGHILRTTGGPFGAGTNDSRWIRMKVPYPHSDHPVACPQRLEQMRDFMMRSAIICRTGRYEEVQLVAARASRWALVQIWKPVKTVERDPLAVCDAATCRDTDWKHRVSAPPNPGISVLSHPYEDDTHQWYYLHGMTPEDMILFKGCDSLQGVPGFTGYAAAHTAIVLPDAESAGARESLEARFLCFWM